MQDYSYDQSKKIQEINQYIKTSKKSLDFYR